MSDQQMPDLGQMFQQVQQMQADMQAAQEALTEERVEGSAGGGMVKAVLTGSGDLVAIEISPDVVDPDDVEMLQDLVVAAIHEGRRRAQELQAERLGGIAGGLDLGGLPGLGA